MSMPLQPGRAGPYAIVVMGVSGCGKTTLGKRLAGDLGSAFLEGDEFHPAQNVRKMAAGIALEDEDRWPWLESLGREIGARARTDGVVVAACSALKKTYRDRLRRTAAVPLFFASLQVSPSVLTARVSARRDHYMPASLLGSQIAILEPPDDTENAIVLDSERGLEELTAAVRAAVTATAQPPSIG